MEKILRCRVCKERFERDEDRAEGRLVSCTAHSFGEIEYEDYAKLGLDPETGRPVENLSQPAAEALPHSSPHTI